MLHAHAATLVYPGKLPAYGIRPPHLYTASSPCLYFIHWFPWYSLKRKSIDKALLFNSVELHPRTLVSSREQQTQCTHVEKNENAER